jgi:hypothetical protein
MAGPLCWSLTRNPAISLGVVLILAVTAAITAWLLAREETHQVRVRERGATDREQIRHRGETILAEAQHLALKAAACGPDSTPVDAQALRADARKALQLIHPTTVKDAMQITRLDHPAPSDPDESQAAAHGIPEEDIDAKGLPRV